MQEIWKPIIGYEKTYEISNTGKVRSIDRVDDLGKKRKERLQNPRLRNGYPSVTLYKDGKRIEHYIHRLVAIHFVENPNNYQIINHKDENRTNNSPDNLEWCTRKYNTNYGTGIEKRAKKQMKKVNQYTPDGLFIKTWDSLKQATMAYYNKKGGSISNCCLGRIKTAYGYKWSYETMNPYGSCEKCERR